MSVAIPVTTAPDASAQLPTLWELGSDLQAETHWIARLSERLDTEDDDERALAIADLEESLALEDNKREAFIRKDIARSRREWLYCYDPMTVALP